MHKSTDVAAFVSIHGHATIKGNSFLYVNILAFHTDSTLCAAVAWAYYWEVCQGNAAKRPPWPITLQPFEGLQGFKTPPPSPASSGHHQYHWCQTCRPQAMRHPHLVLEGWDLVDGNQHPASDHSYCFDAGSWERICPNVSKCHIFVPGTFQMLLQEHLLEDSLLLLLDCIAQKQHLEWLRRDNTLHTFWQKIFDIVTMITKWSVYGKLLHACGDQLLQAKIIITNWSLRVWSWFQRYSFAPIQIKAAVTAEYFSNLILKLCSSLPSWAMLSNNALIGWRQACAASQIIFQEIVL